MKKFEGGLRVHVSILIGNEGGIDISELDGNLNGDKFAEYIDSKVSKIELL